MRKIDEKIRHQVIICGFGEFAREVLKYLGTTSPAVVSVEIDPEIEAQLREEGLELGERLAGQGFDTRHGGPFGRGDSIK